MVQNAVQFPSIDKPHWIVAPTFRQVKEICWVRLKQILRFDPSWIFNEQELSAVHPVINTKLALKGSDNEDSLRGVGCTSMGVDEAAMIKRNVWPEILRPMLADTQGPCLFISTPKGRNWFYDLYIQKTPEWKAWHYPTSINGYISPDEIAQAKKDMSERLFLQEFMAEFLDEDTGVFKKIRQCAIGQRREPTQGRFYLMGVDLAKTQDFTVLTVIDSVTREVVAKERFQDVSWKEQKIRIQALALKYNRALCIVDSTGLGDPIYEDLMNSGVSCEGYKFTNDTKCKLIENLAIAIEQRLITFPPDEDLLDELRSYEYTITDQGRIKYSAPEGKHDDCVISLGLAVWGIRHMMKEAQVLIHDEAQYVQDKQGMGERVEPQEDSGFERGY